MPIKLLCYNIGALISFEDLHYKSLNHAIEDYLGDDYIIDITQRHKFEGIATKNKLLKLQGIHHLEDVIINKIYKKKQEYTKQYLAEFNFSKYGYIKDLVKKIKNKGYKIAICTNSIQDTTEYVLHQLEIYATIDFYLCNENIEHTNEIYKMAMDIANVEPYETVIFEERDGNIEEVKSTGAHYTQITSCEQLRSIEFTLNILNTLNDEI